MSTFIFPRITLDSATASQTPTPTIAVSIYRPGDGKTFDFGTNTFVATTPTQRLFNLTQDANNPEMFVAKQGSVTGFETTSFPLQFTDGAYDYLFYNNSTGTPILIDPVSVTLVGGVEAQVGTATVTGPVTVGGYSSGQDPASLVLATPAHRLATDASGNVADTPGTTTLLARITGAVHPTTGDAYALVNPLVAAGAFTTAALANAPAGTATLDAHTTAILSGDVTENADGSFDFFTRGTSTKVATFVPKAGTGGRTVTYF